MLLRLSAFSRVSLAVAFASTLFSVTSCKPRTSQLKEADGDNPYEGYEGYGLSPEQERGRRTWYEACGDNGRAHTYVMPQKMGAPQNWYKVLGSATRDKRWSDYGMIPDPDCKPGNESSYEFDICLGDESEHEHITPVGQVGPNGERYVPLLKAVGTHDFNDPGCWISGSYKKEDCPLGLGTSTGALGFRKFPNPKFKKENWKGWANYDPMDGSQEPPFLIGTACGSCHITFNPNDPPEDPAHPKWRNIKGLVGNQFQNMEEIIGSGLNPKSVEWQGIITARPGVVDTSAHPTDLVRNPNTVNAIINILRRPPGLPPAGADKDPAFASEQFKPFDKLVIDEHGNKKVQRVHNILKGGEDDVGGAGAILRVYINEGLCAETCWMNHLLDARSITGRYAEQTPFSAAQCRADCPNYRAIEDRYGDVLQFFASKAGDPTDLKDAMFPNEPKENRRAKLLEVLGPEKVAQGRAIYARRCATCHSSLQIPKGMRKEDFFNGIAKSATNDNDPFVAEENGVRVDWPGNEEREPVTKIGTNRCRALHSNHERGHIWDEFSSETYKNSPDVPGIPELRGKHGGGRGYYRNPSLLSVWVQAPFMHNNAIGPELCNKVHNRYPVCQGDDLGSGECCVDKDAVPLADGRRVKLTSIEGRRRMFEVSMHQLLDPTKRGRKVTRTDDDIVIPLGPQNEGVDFSGMPFLSHFGLLAELWGGSATAKVLEGLKVVIPKGTPVALIGSLDYRTLAKGIAKQIASVPVAERPRRAVEAINTLFRDPDKLASVLEAGPRIAGEPAPAEYSGYSNCTDVIEDRGHEVGVKVSESDPGLSEDEKEALIAFMQTL